MASSEKCTSPALGLSIEDDSPLLGQMLAAGVRPAQPLADQDAIRTRANWSPYDDNGGTVLAVAGNDYCIIAGSKRLSTGFSILSRERSMLMQMNDKVVVAAAGFQGDVTTLMKVLKMRHVTYQHNHGRPMGSKAVAQLMMNTLYSRRFFPYYSFTIVAGLDDEGKGAVFSYDAVGSYERTGYTVQGSGKDLIQPVLDNQLKASSALIIPEERWMSNLPIEEAVDLVKSAFVSAGERDIYTGDAVEILILTADGVRREEVDLKKD